MTEPLKLYAPREIDAGTPRFATACDRLVQALVQHRGNARHLAVAHFPPQDHEDKTTAESTAERRIRAWLRVALNHKRDLRAEAERLMQQQGVAPWSQAESAETRAQGTAKKAPAKKAPAPKVTAKRTKRAARAA